MKAISIRQPWAWLIVHGHKDVENRTWPTHFRGPVLIHAGATMTKADYEACVIFISGMQTSWRLPAYDILKAQCGGIVGEAEIVDCVTQSESPWFVGEFGFVVRDARPLAFQRCKGALSFFTAQPPASVPPAPVPITSVRLAVALARAIFEAGNHGSVPCRRIQFMGGTYAKAETPLGGLCEPSLAALLMRKLEEWGCPVTELKRPNRKGGQT
jgi:hypothetical protein